MIFIQNLVDLAIEGDSSRFVTMFLYGVAFMVIVGVIYFINAMLGVKFKTTIMQSIRKDVYNSIMKRDAIAFESSNTAEYVSSLTNDMNIISDSYIGFILIALGGIVSSIAAIALMLFYSPLLTLVAIACSALSIVVPIVFTKPMQKAQHNVSKANSNFTVQLNEAFLGHSVITAFGAIAQFGRRFVNKNDDLMAANYKLGKLSSGTTSVSQMITITSDFVMILCAGLMVIGGYITVGTLVLFSTLYGVLGSGASMIMQLMPHIRSAKPVIDKISKLIDYSNDSFNNNQIPSLQNKVQVQNLSFSYHGDATVINNISIEIRRNEKVALVGGSGSGKTTLAKLLCGVYTNYSGGISYDDVELKQIDNEQLRKLVAIVPQNTYLFDDTIYYNICLDEEFSNDALNTALEQSGVSKFIPQMKNGLHTLCGQNGNELSGGQKQRIALARALIRNAKFIILDEGVSALDIETANEIEQGLLNIEDLTLLTITHRVKDGLINKYDKIVNM